MRGIWDFLNRLANRRFSFRSGGIWDFILGLKNANPYHLKFLFLQTFLIKL